MAATNRLKIKNDIGSIEDSLLANSLYGHTIQLQFLQNLFKPHSSPQALLFEGKSGIGKASIAIKLAYKLITGNVDALDKPLKSDKILQQMLAGSSQHFLYLHNDNNSKQTSSNISVTAVRDIQKFLSYKLSANSWRVVLIDSLQDLSYSAANALLKILEEPPINCLFIIISHAAKGLDTIRSRCQILKFNPLSNDLLDKIFIELMPDSYLTLNQPEKTLLAEVAAGSVKDGMIFLSYGGTDIFSAITELLQNSYYDYLLANQIADNIVKSSESRHYELFCNLLSAILVYYAKLSISLGQQQDANDISCLWQKLQTQLTEIANYNVDKKQFILVWLQDIHQILNKTQLILHFKLR